MLEIRIAPEIAEAGVRLTLGVLQGDVTVAERHAKLEEGLTDVSAKRAAELADTPVGQIDNVAEARQAYKALGKDPSRYRPSSEALLRRVVQGKPLPQVNTLVDTNNMLSITTGFSIGTYDVSRLTPPLVCRRGSAGESYDAIGRGPINLEGLPLLADAEGPFGSPTSDSQRAMIGLEAKEILMVIFGFDFSDDLMQSHLLGAKGVLEFFCEATDIEYATITQA